MPDLYRQYVDIAKKLELGYKDVQDMKFTIEREVNYTSLQTRSSKELHAAVKLPIDICRRRRYYF